MFEIEKINKIILGNPGCRTTPITYKKFIFPGGEVHIKLDDDIIPDYSSSSIIIKIVGNISSSDDLVELMLLKDIIDRLYLHAKMHIIIPYFPYARQDRVTSKLEPFSLRVIANVINSLNFHSVSILDAHSDVATGLINRCENISPVKYITKMLPDKFTYFVSPDAGAYKKVSNYAMAMPRNIDVIVCSKHRDINTGMLSNPIVYDHNWDDKTADLLIIDDICDGGRTFLNLADVLRPKMTGSAKLKLLVTHGIFSNGFDELLKKFDEIFFINDMRRDKSQFLPPNVFNIEF